MIDSRIDHLTDHPMDVTLISWYICLGLYTHEVVRKSDMY
jgi:hypothetical protein